MGCGCSNTDEVIVKAKTVTVRSLREIFQLPVDAKTREAVDNFNAGNPKAALVSLSLESDAKAAASWLHHTPGLDCAILGDLLGDPKQTPLMQAYIYKFAFARLGLEAALRMLLRSFRLPGEAQKIDRLMECFSAHWCECRVNSLRRSSLSRRMSSNVSVCDPALVPDAAYVVSFALIMLNTDLHNPSVKRKMSQEQFTRAISGVEGGSDFPLDWMEQLYCSIRDNEIVMECKLTKRQLPAALNSDLPAEVVAQSQLLGKFRGVVHMVKTNPKRASAALQKAVVADESCHEPDQQVCKSPQDDSMMSI